ncbi:hypothetical protein JCM10213v2_003224 [Rhodosporidiobolus nylandii]
MLLSLPVELVERVLRDVDAHDLTYEAYCGRQATLQACCLVSSGLRAVAQPILEESAWVPHERDLQKWTERLARLELVGFRWRFLFVEFVPYRGSKALRSLLAYCPCLQELWLNGGPHVELEYMDKLAISFGYPILQGAPYEPFATRERFPSLKYLAVYDGFYGGCHNTRQVLEADVARGLMYLSSTLDAAKLARDAPPTGPCPVLFDCTLDLTPERLAIVSRRIEYMRLDGESYDDSGHTPRLVFRDLATTPFPVEPGLLRLKLLLLPTFLLSPMYKQKRHLDAFLLLCKSCGIKVDFEDRRDDGSPKFERYLAEQKRAEAVQWAKYLAG